jgi:hypothetical protein
VGLDPRRNDKSTGASEQPQQGERRYEAIMPPKRKSRNNENGKRG